MSRRTAAWLAWSLWALCVALFAVTMASVLLSTPPKFDNPIRFSDPLIVLFRSMALTFPTVGAFLASRRPENPIGWILCGTGFLTSVRSFAEAYADFGLWARPGLLPGVEYMAWLASWMGMPVVLSAAALLVLVFPDGKLLDRAWWAVVWMAVGGAVLVAPSMALDPYPKLNLHPIPNPFAFEGSLYDDIIGPLGSLGIMLLLVSLLCAGVSILVRVDKGSRIERQQIKWLAYSFALMIVGLGLAVSDVLFFVGVAAFNFFPIAVGIAVLRYRLFDIDVIINRTLVYGTLTGTLALVYFGGVTVTQALLRTLTDQQELPQLVIVVSTLVIAAMFNPLRRRIQSFIDRGFYRRKYDAAKTLEGFSTKLRDETDLEALRGDLVGVVTETMQPAHVSLWLRSETARKREQGG